METSSAIPQSIIQYIEPTLGRFCRPGRCTRTRDLIRLESERKQTREQLAEKDAIAAALRTELEHQVGMLRKLRSKVYGERKPAPQTATNDVQANAEGDIDEQGRQAPVAKLKGGQLGQQGHGRKIPDHLPVVEHIHEPRPKDTVCCRCGSLYPESGLVEDASEITVKVDFEVIRHRRKRFFKACDYPETPASITAPRPPKVIPKGLNTHAFLALVLTWEYGFQIALTRMHPCLS